jgi:flavin-dependent dehydrogenase
MLEVSPDILNRISGADVIFPGGGRFEVRFGKTAAVLVDRPGLDRKLAEKASDLGAEMMYGTKCTGISMSPDGVSIHTGSTDIESRIVIGADGQRSSLISNNAPKEFVFGIGADIRHRPEHDDIMTLRIGSEFAPGFFSWEIPFGDMVRIGLCIKEGGNTPNHHLKKLRKAVGAEDKETVSRYSGKIPIGGRPRSYGERTLLIGDAAGQVKPISGGGMYPICKAAPILAETVKSSLEAGDTSSRYLSRYEKGWKKEMGKEMSRGYRIRKMYTALSDKDLDKVFRIINRDDMRSILSSIDIDDPSGVAAAMLRNPQVCIRFLPFMLRGMI